MKTFTWIAGNVRSVLRIATLVIVLLGPTVPAGAQVSVQWLYQRNSANITDGRLHLMYGWDSLVNWRGGSGSVANECQKQTAYQSGGYLPGGTYSTLGHSYNWGGQLIKGPVIRLSDKVCSNGVTVRDELFVHSSFPWGPPSTYYSHGCIKLASTGTASTANGHIREVVDLHVWWNSPPHLVVW